MSGERLTLLPYQQEAWDGTDMCHAAEALASAAMGGSCRYVGQRGVEPFDVHNGSPVIWSDGFVKCAALLMHDTIDQTYVFSHIDPAADELYGYFERHHGPGQQWRGPRIATLVYGSRSVRQPDFERTLASGEWGPASVYTVDAPTGAGRWAAVFAAGQHSLAILRQDPDRSVYRYSFPAPLAVAPLSPA